MGEVQGDLGGDQLFALVRDEGQEHYFGLWLYVIPQELVERRELLILVDLEAMISVVYRLPEYLISHRPKVVGEGRHDFLVFEKLEAAEVRHVDEDVVVQLDLEVATFLYEEGEGRLLLRELVY